MEGNLTGEPLCAENKKAAQENFLRCFCSRVGFGAGFSKNAENQHTGQMACFGDKNSQSKEKDRKSVDFRS